MMDFGGKVWVEGSELRDACCEMVDFGSRVWVEGSWLRDAVRW